MSERRRYARWSKRVRVRYWLHGSPDKMFNGFTKDISRGGAFLATNNTFKVGSRLQMEFITDTGGFLLEGVVARSIKLPLELQKVKTGGMGVRFLTLDELLKEVHPSAVPVEEAPRVEARVGQVVKEDGIASKKQPANRTGKGAPPERAETGAVRDARHRDASADGSNGPPNPRFNESRSYITGKPPIAWRKGKDSLGELGSVVGEDKGPARRAYPVRFLTLDEFLRSYENDLRAGGLFVSTTSPAPVDSEILLVLQLPESDEAVRVEATVVHVTEANSGSKGPNLLAGMGVSFSDQKALDKLAAFVEQRRRATSGRASPGDGSSPADSSD